MDAAPKVGVVVEEMVESCFIVFVGSDVAPVLESVGPLVGCFVVMLMFGGRGNKSDGGRGSGPFVPLPHLGTITWLIAAFFL